MTKTDFTLESVTQVIFVENAESTQALARALADEQAHGTLVLACHQTGALDAHNRPFPSSEGGVYFTLMLKPSKELDLTALTRAAAESVAQTLQKVFELKTKILDGDVFVWHKPSHKYQKIACLWAEENESGAVLINALICVNNQIPLSYKKELVSLKMLIGTETSKELFLDDVLTNFWKEYTFL